MPVAEPAGRNRAADRSPTDTLAPVRRRPVPRYADRPVTDAIGQRAALSTGANVPMRPASTNKVLTTAAALVALDRDAAHHRVMASGPTVSSCQGWR